MKNILFINGLKASFDYNTKIRHYRLDKTVDLSKLGILKNIFQNDGVYLKKFNVEKNNIYSSDELIKKYDKSEFIYLPISYFNAVLIIKGENHYDVFECENYKLDEYDYIDINYKSRKEVKTAHDLNGYSISSKYSGNSANIVSISKDRFCIKVGSYSKIGRSEDDVRIQYYKNYLKIYFNKPDDYFIFKQNKFIKSMDTMYTSSPISIHELEFVINPIYIEDESFNENDVLNAFGYDDSTVLSVVDKEKNLIHFIIRTEHMIRTSLVVLIDKNNCVKQVLKDCYAYKGDDLVGKKFIETA